MRIKVLFVAQSKNLEYHNVFFPPLFYILNSHLGCQVFKVGGHFSPKRCRGQRDIV